MSAKKRIAHLCAALGLVATLTVTLATPAQAANQDGVQETNEMVYYYNSGLAGAWSDFAWNVPNLAGYAYIGGGTGANGFGDPVKNNAASVRNKHSTAAIHIYYNSGYGGYSNKFYPNMSGNLSPTLKNENASHQWMTP
ncbi:MAG: hypothetical protein QM713_04050 [Arachnia sp.]